MEDMLGDNVLYKFVSDNFVIFSQTMFTKIKENFIRLENIQNIKERLHECVVKAKISDIVITQNAFEVLSTIKLVHVLQWCIDEYKCDIVTELYIIRIKVIYSMIASADYISR